MYPEDLVLAGNFAYVASGILGLIAIDIADPVSPRWAGIHDTTGTALGISFAGSTLIVADGEDGLKTVDVSRLSTVRRVGGIDTLSVVGNLCVADKVAYLVGDSGLELVDVQDPASPRRLATVEGPYATGVEVSGGLAFVAAVTAGLEVYDVRNPHSPTNVGNWKGGRQVVDVAVSGSHAFVLDGEQGLLVLDTLDPSNLRTVGGVPLQGNPRSLCLKDGIAFVAAGSAGLIVMDVRDPAHPIVLGRYEPGGHPLEVFASETLLYVAAGPAGLIILDVSDPVAPETVATLAGESAVRVAASGNRAYVVTGGNELMIVDVTDPAMPRSLGRHFPTRGSAASIVIDGNVGYLAAGWLSLGILNLEDPTARARSASMTTTVRRAGWRPRADKSMWRVTGASKSSTSRTDRSPADRLLRHRGTNRRLGRVRTPCLHLTSHGRPIDLRHRRFERATPHRRIDVGNAMSELWVEADVVYVADESTGLHIIDISDPAQPKLIRSDASLGGAILHISGKLAFATHQNGGLQILDISDRAQIRQVGLVNGVHGALSLACLPRHGLRCCRTGGCVCRGHSRFRLTQGGFPLRHPRIRSENHALARPCFGRRRREWSRGFS